METPNRSPVLAPNFQPSRFAFNQHRRGWLNANRAGSMLSPAAWHAERAHFRVPVLVGRRPNGTPRSAEDHV
jgi:hypothetical protein